MKIVNVAGARPIPPLWDGHAAGHIAQILVEKL